MPRTGRPRTFDETTVLAEARDLFWARGYRATSVQEHVDGLALQQGSLYGAFGDKEGLFRRVFDDYCAASDEAAVALLDGPEDKALDRARAWLRAVEGPSDRRGCLLAKATAELSCENEAVATRSLAAFQTLLENLRRLVEQAQRAGQVDPDADAGALGGLILTTHRGLEALAKAGVDAPTRSRIAAAAIDSIALTPART